MNTNYTLMVEKSDSIRIVDNLLPTAVEPERTELLAKRESLFQAFGNLQTSNRGLWTSVNYRRNTMVETIGTENDAITATEVYEQNEKTVNEIYLRTFAQGTFTLDATQLATLATIAEQCPLTGGNAVFRARSMVAVMGGMPVYDNDSLCYSVGERSGDIAETEVIPVGFTIFPNPAKDEIRVIIQEDLLLEKPGLFIIYDIIGNIALQRTISGKESSILIDTKALSAGVYHCTVFQEGKILKTAKLVLVK